MVLVYMWRMIDTQGFFLDQQSVKLNQHIGALELDNANAFNAVLQQIHVTYMDSVRMEPSAVPRKLRQKLGLRRLRRLTSPLLTEE